MKLPRPRKAETEATLTKYADRTTHYTTGDPEKIIWASIRQFCAHDRAVKHLETKHKIHSDAIAGRIAINIQIYIRQAEQFYRAATNSQLDVAPLFFLLLFFEPR